MNEIADESEHSKQMMEWSTKTKTGKDGTEQKVESISNLDADKQITALYKKSVEESGVRIIAGERLGPHHIFANFWQEHPFKLLTLAGVPTVLYIFKGRNNKQHLQLQSKIMHTRVFGQFAVIGMLLTLMGFKEYMDKYGKFITQADADMRVVQMQRMRKDLMDRLEHDKKMKKYREEMIRKATIKQRSQDDENLNDKKKKQKIQVNEI